MRSGPSSAPSRAAPSPAMLVGRAGELATLDRVLRRLDRGQGSEVAILGEAGLGKTVLLDELVSRVGAIGARVLRGRASEFERDAPLALITDAFRGQSEELTAVTLRYLAHQRLRERLTALADDGPPVVLVLDDLHWADDATIDLVVALVDRPPDGRVLLALGYRPAERLARVEAVMAAAAAAADRLTERLVLAPLDLAESTQLVGSRIDPSRVAELHELCGGNPLYLEQLTVEHGEQAASLPDAVAASVASELAPFGIAARSLIEAASLLGDPFDATLAVEVAELDASGGATAALDALVRAGLLRPVPDATAPDFRFRHPLVRRVVHDGLSAVARRAGHARAVAALSRRGASPTTLAGHVVASAERGDAAAIGVLTAAGTAVATRAPSTAGRWLSAAWDLVPELERSEPDHLPLAAATVVTLTVTGEGQRALALLDAVLADLPTGHSARNAGVQAAAWVERMLGRTQPATRRLQAELVRTGPGSEAKAIGLASDLAMSLARIDDLDGARQALERAVQLIGVAGLAPATCGVLPRRAWIEALAGDVAVATEACDAAMAAWTSASRTGGVTPTLEERTLVMATLWCLDRLRAWEEHAELGVVASRDGGTPLLAVGLIASRAMAAARRGALGEALADARDASEEADLMAVPGAGLWPAIATATALEPTQALDRARHAAERAVALARLAGDGSYTLATAGQTLAQVELALGLPGRALATLRATHGGDAMDEAPLLWRTRGLALASVAMSSLGDDEGARRAAAQARGACSPLLTGATRVADYADAVVALAAGDGAAAARLAERARRLASDAGDLLDASRMQLIEAAGLSAAGDLDAAMAAWREAESAFARMGADRLQGEALRALRRHGRRIAPTRRDSSPTPACAEVLTGRQREIALLVADGLTNRQIAERLVVTPKTVEYHLAGVFAKLGVRSRRELADGDVAETLRRAR